MLLCSKTEKTDTIKKDPQSPRPLKAIRAYCVQGCNAGKPSGVRKCTDVDCPLFAFRFGKNPKRRGKGHLGNLWSQNQQLSGSF